MQTIAAWIKRVGAVTVRKGRGAARVAGVRMVAITAGALVSLTDRGRHCERLIATPSRKGYSLLVHIVGRVDPLTVCLARGGLKRWIEPNGVLAWLRANLPLAGSVEFLLEPHSA